MQKVTGIGGVFILAKDPETLGQWYQKYLGVPVPPESYAEPEWKQQEGPTVFAFMGADSEHFLQGKSVGINFRVDNLVAMVAQLNQAGIEVVTDSKKYPNGIFASLTDPEGNMIQLWEPHKKRPR